MDVESREWFAPFSDDRHLLRCTNIQCARAAKYFTDLENLFDRDNCGHGADGGFQFRDIRLVGLLAAMDHNAS